MDKAWYAIHRNNIQIYEQAHKEIFDEIQIEDQNLLKQEERTSRSRDKPSVLLTEDKKRESSCDMRSEKRRQQDYQRLQINRSGEKISEKDKLLPPPKDGTKRMVQVQDKLGFILLNASLVNIDKDIKDSRLLLLDPRPLRVNMERRLKDKVFAFHRDHRHKTNDCLDLKEQIRCLLEIVTWKNM